MKKSVLRRSPCRAASAGVQNEHEEFDGILEDDALAVLDSDAQALKLLYNRRQGDVGVVGYFVPRCQEDIIPQKIVLAPHGF